MLWINSSLKDYQRLIVFNVGTHTHTHTHTRARAHTHIHINDFYFNYYYSYKSCLVTKRQIMQFVNKNVLQTDIWKRMIKEEKTKNIHR